ncbi:hypothetical protein ACHAW5_010482 [Stephanodiscus triporus]|uniref:AB hydrolase-1 domain-containing protein n=1 Tax=Stephanodiscus triporus TaxID=2934178 RepID=A0ABD3MQX2_9STRA
MLDIRGHGNSSTAASSSSSSSSSSSNFDRPHDFRNCVNDVLETLVPLGLVGNDSPTAICGHSLGGRLALEYTHSVMRAASAGSSSSSSSFPAGLRVPRQTWILDSVPGRADPSVHGVLRAVSSLRRPFPSRGWVVNELIGERHGLDRSLANWIATGLREGTRGGGDDNNDDGGGGGGGGGEGSSSASSSLDWAFDLDVANELVENFATQDFVGMVRDVTTASSPSSSSTSPSDGGLASTAVHLVMAGKSNMWTEDIVSELESIPSFVRGSPSSSSSSSSFHMHKLDRAGHWVHVDDLEGLLTYMVDGLQSGRP